MGVMIIADNSNRKASRRLSKKDLTCREQKTHNGNRSDDNRLKDELDRLQTNLHLDQKLQLNWIPNGSDKLSGEVKNDTIYIYERNEEAALRTLRHEVLDYVISQLIEPYKQVTNSLISIINEDAYKRKEKVVDNLEKLLAELKLE